MQGNSDFGPHKKRRTIQDYQKDAFSTRVTGILSLARSGVGFVTPENGGADILVPERDVGAALPGDTVEVQMLPPDRPGGRPLGRVLSVLSRATQDFVCTLHREGRYWTAVPILACGNRTFNIKKPGTARDGDRVIVRFSAWDNPHLNPDAELVGVIGSADNPSLDTLAIEKAWHLQSEFPEEVLREAQAVSARLKTPGERLDLRDACIITIDPETARDYDDALSLTVDEKGRRVLGVHIADVSHFVREGSALDQEARKRGTSVYLIDHVLPMLPEQLSNGVCSLVQGEDRLAFSAFITFDGRGTPVARNFARSIIRSSRRMTYEEAMQVIEQNGVGPEAVPAHIRTLIGELHALSQQLRRNRFDHFSLDLTSNEPRLILGPDGRVTDILPSEHNAAHELVEEAMIAANEAVAWELASRRIPHLCRFHDAPDPEKLEELRTSLEGIGLRCGDLSNPGVLLRLLRAVRGTGLDSYVSMLVLRAMKRAEYSADNEGHFGLAKRYYSHFTSPIRRYPDLVAHRQLALALAGDRTRQPARETLRAIAWSSTKTEFNAAQAERDLEEIKKYRFLEEKLRQGKPPVFDGVVVRVMEFGAFIEVPALQISGMAHVSAISSSFLRYDGFRQHLTGGGLDIGPGTHVRVSVTHVDYEQRHIDFTVREVEKTAAPDFALSLKEKADAHAPAGRAARIPFGPLAGKPVPRTRKAKKAGPATAAEKKAATKRKKAAAQKEKLAKKERRADKKAARTPKAASRLVSRPLRPGRSASAHHEP